MDSVMKKPMNRFTEDNHLLLPPHDNSPRRNGAAGIYFDEMLAG
jgi:hypothetical protein